MVLPSLLEQSLKPVEPAEVLEWLDTVTSVLYVWFFVILQTFSLKQIIKISHVRLSCKTAPSGRSQHVHNVVDQGGLSKYLFFDARLFFIYSMLHLLQLYPMLLEILGILTYFPT